MLAVNPSNGASSVFMTVPNPNAAGLSGGSALFVANTGNDTVVKIPVVNGTAGQPAVFVNSINGADGLVIDARDNI